MADLTEIQSAQPVKVIGSDSTGVEQTPVQSTSAGGLHTNLRNNAGTEVGTSTNPISVTALNTATNGVRYTSRQVVASLGVKYLTQTLAARTAINKMYVGGRAACEAMLARYVDATTSLGGNGTGGFNSNGDVAAWTKTGIGDGALGAAWAYTTTQAQQGTGSATYTFTKSDINNYPEISYNFSTPQDLTSWRYVSAYFRCTVGAGAVQTRTFQLRITSTTNGVTATRIWQTVGQTTDAEAWVLVSGEIENPTLTSGTGVFDITQITQVSLRMVDGGNKTGTLYVDNYFRSGAITALEKVYSAGGSTMGIEMNPSYVFEIGETAMVSYRNNSASPAEIQANVSGVTT